MQHADSGHGESNGRALVGGRRQNDAVRLVGLEDHGVDVIADIDAAGPGQELTDHHLVGACGIGQATRHQPWSSDVLAAVADGGEHAAPAERLAETRRWCARLRDHRDAGEHSHPTNARHLCKSVVERARVETRSATGWRDEQLGRIHHIEEATVGGRGAPGAGRRREDHASQHRDEQRQADPDTPTPSEVRRAVGTQRPRPHGDCRTALLSRPGGDHPSSGWCYLPRRGVVWLGVVTRPVGRRPGLQLDESRLRPAPRCVGVRSTGAGLPGGACSSDRHVELPASLVQRRGMPRGDTLGLASLLLFESGTLAMNPLTLRRLSQCRREPLDRVLGLERRRRLWSSPAGHRSTVWLGSGASPRRGHGHPAHAGSDPTLLRQETRERLVGPIRVFAAHGERCGALCAHISHRFSVPTRRRDPRISRESQFPSAPTSGRPRSSHPSAGSRPSHRSESHERCGRAPPG